MEKCSILNPVPAQRGTACGCDRQQRDTA